MNYAYSLLLTQLLAPRAFADFAAAESLLLVCGTLATSSMPWVVARVLSEPGTSEQARRQVIWFSVVVNLLQGLLAAAVLCLIGSRFLSPSSLVAVAIGTVGIFLTTTPGGWLQGRRRFDRLAFFRVLEVVVKLVVGAALVVAGARDTGALVGVAAGALVVVAAGLVMMRSELHRAPGALRVRSLWSASLGNVGVQGLVAVLASTDVVLVAVLDGGSADSGSYQAAAILGRVPVFLAGALGAAAFPTLVASARAASDVRGTSVSSYSWLAGAYALALVTAPAVLVSLVFPGSYASSTKCCRGRRSPACWWGWSTWSPRSSRPLLSTGRRSGCWPSPFPPTSECCSRGGSWPTSGGSRSPRLSSLRCWGSRCCGTPSLACRDRTRQ